MWNTYDLVYIMVQILVTHHIIQSILIYNKYVDVYIILIYIVLLEVMWNYYFGLVHYDFLKL